MNHGIHGIHGKGLTLEFDEMAEVEFAIDAGQAAPWSKDVNVGSDARGMVFIPAQVDEFGFAALLDV